MIFAPLVGKLSLEYLFLQYVKGEKTSFCCAKEAKFFLKTFHLVGDIMINIDIKLSFYQFMHLIPSYRKVLIAAHHRPDRLLLQE